MNEFKSIMHETTLGLANWQWAGLGLGILLGFALRPILKKLIRILCNYLTNARALHPLVRSLLNQALDRPLAWIAVCALWQVLISLLDLPIKFEKYVAGTNHLIEGIAAISLTYLAVEAGGTFMTLNLRRVERGLTEQLVTLSTKTGKILVVVFGSLIILQDLGFNVIHLVAGLGLGAFSLALAAQDTVANLFGSVTIILDRPFSVGDWVKVGDCEGVVEDIGFRSTRIRTFYQSLISVPNSIMAKEKIDNMGVRPSRRISHNFVVDYSSSHQQILQFIEAIKTLARAQPHVLADTITVYAQKLSDSGVTVNAQFFVNVVTGAEELTIQQNFLLQVKETALALGVALAYPTQTIHLSKQI